MILRYFYKQRLKHFLKTVIMDPITGLTVTSYLISSHSKALNVRHLGRLNLRQREKARLKINFINAEKMIDALEVALDTLQKRKGFKTPLQGLRNEGTLHDVTIDEFMVDTKGTPIPLDEALAHIKDLMLSIGDELRSIKDTNKHAYDHCVRHLDSTYLDIVEFTNGLLLGLCNEQTRRKKY